MKLLKHILITLLAAIPALITSAIVMASAYFTYQGFANLHALHGWDAVLCFVMILMEIVLGFFMWYDIGHTQRSYYMKKNRLQESNTDEIVNKTNKEEDPKPTRTSKTSQHKNSI